VTHSSALTGVSFTQAALEPAAKALAEALGLPFLPAPNADLGLVLRYSPAGLELMDPAPGAPGAVRVDFGQLRHRALSLRGETVARAVGLKGNQPLRVIDATAGLGRDAFVLASLGADVVLIERAPVVAALLADGLARAATDPALAPVAARMQLLQGNALDLLPDLQATHAPDAIYLDPMYPEAGTKGQVKKEMQLLRRLLGPDPDIEPLFQLALSSRARRIVLKRPRRAPPMAGPAPNHSLEGRSTRFDVYLRPGRS
jgi:16S rRNA (guanine1516-N2)-methyltransferase